MDKLKELSWQLSGAVSPPRKFMDRFLIQCSSIRAGRGQCSAPLIPYPLLYGASSAPNPLGLPLPSRARAASITGEFVASR